MYRVVHERGERMSQLEKLRLEKRMTRQQLADAARVTRVSIYRYEHGRRVPNVDTASRLAKALECSIEELVTRSDEDK